MSYSAITLTITSATPSLLIYQMYCILCYMHIVKHSQHCFIVSNVLPIMIHFIILLPALFHCIKCGPSNVHFIIILLPAVLNFIISIAHCETFYQNSTSSVSLYQMYLPTVIHYFILLPTVLHCIKCIAHCDTLFHIATCSDSLYLMYFSL